MVTASAQQKFLSSFLLNQGHFGFFQSRTFPTVHFGSFLGDNPLAGLQQGLAVRHVRLGAGRGEGRGGGGRQLLQLEEVQAHVGAAEEPAAPQAAAAVPAALVADAGFLGPEEPQSGGGGGEKIVKTEAN